MSISSANLLWQHRFRGLMAAGHHNVSNDGRALVIKPDGFERRTYQLLDVKPDGTAAEVGAVCVETVSKFDGLPGGQLVVGMTANDIYVFREGRKARFMPDRRVTYTDVHLSPENGWFACSFADPVFSAYGLAFGDGNARLSWTRDLTSTPNRVAISGDGQVIVAGMQDGRLLAMDNLRAPLWECVQPDAVTALALPVAGARPIAGTAEGTVLALDHEGGFRWRCTTGLPVIGVATDAEARWVAAAVSDQAIHRIICFDGDGTPIWEHDLEEKPSGIGLSQNGRYLLVSAVNGAVALFEIDLATAAVGAGPGRRRMHLELARSAEAAGDLVAARDLLKAITDPTPYDLESANELGRVEHALVERLRDEARAHAEDGHLLDALSTITEAQALRSWDAGLFAERLEYRNRALDECRERALALEAKREWMAASVLWLEAVRLDPADPVLREELIRVRIAESNALVEIGDALAAASNFDQAIANWQNALRLNDTEALRDRLRRVEIDRGVASGIALYEAQRLPEAAFQFRKVLALDPNHEKAQRYLGYTQSPPTDTVIADRFSRLE